MCYKPFKKEWDINNEEVDFKKKIGANAYIYYSKTKSKMGFEGRDFILNYLVNIEADGTLMVAASS